MKPLTSENERLAEAVLEAFCSAYRKDFGKNSNNYPRCLSYETRNDLDNSIGTHLGIRMSDAKIDEILAEVCDLHQLDGKSLLFEGEEYEPEDDGYPRALNDREQTYRRWIRHLIREQAKK